MIKLKALKILTVAFVLALTGCGDKTGTFVEPPALYTPSATGVRGASAKMAMLVPLSGPSSALGEDLKRAGMMAQFDKMDTGSAVLFYDTKGTAQGAVDAYHEALNEKPDLIIGPVFSGEVAAVKRQNPTVPVLSFTSDGDAVGDGVYTMALMIPEQVKRIVSYACEAGQRKMAVLGPENKVGELVMNTLASEVTKCPGMEIHKVSLYAPKTVNFDPAILKIIPKPVDPKKANLTEAEREILHTPIAERVDFDSLLVFEEGIKLQQVMSLLSYYDVTPRAIPMYGLSSWQSATDAAFVGGYFPALPMKSHQDFDARYRQNFGSKPAGLASLAYDAVSLGTLLASVGVTNESMITQPAGFVGVDGRIRIEPDGTNTRLLDMMQMTGRGRFQVVSPASSELPPRTNSFWFSEGRATFDVERTTDRP